MIETLLNMIMWYITKKEFIQKGINSSFLSNRNTNSFVEINITSRIDTDTTLEVVISDYSARRGLGYSDDDSRQTHYCCTTEYEEKGICSEVGSLILAESNTFIKRYSFDLIPYNIYLFIIIIIINRNKNTYKQIQINSSDYYFIYFVKYNFFISIYIYIN